MLLRPECGVRVCDAHLRIVCRRSQLLSEQQALRQRLIDVRRDLVRALAPPVACPASPIKPRQRALVSDAGLRRSRVWSGGTLRSNTRNTAAMVRVRSALNTEQRARSQREHSTLSILSTL